MTALIVIASIIGYILVGIQTSRLLTGHFRYNKWLSEYKHGKSNRYGGTQLEYDEWWPAYDDSTFNAGMVSALLLPVAVLMVLCMSVGDGQWAIDPRPVRKERELKEARKRIAELEKVTGIPS